MKFVDIIAGFAMPFYALYGLNVVGVGPISHGGGGRPTLPCLQHHKKPYIIAGYNLGNVASIFAFESFCNHTTPCPMLVQQ